MNRTGRLPILLLMLACTLPAGAAAPVPAPANRPPEPLPPQARVRVELNQLLQLHHWLRARCGAPPRPEYEPACAVYRELQRSSTPGAVWQFANDACALGPDIQAVAARAGRLPATMDARESAAARRLLGALAAAWPVYEKHDLIELNRALQLVTMMELRRRWSIALEPLVMRTLYDRLFLRPLESPVTIFAVTHGTHMGDWGKTSKGYYLIQPMVGQPVIASLVHELTHVLESGQPAGERTFLRRLQEAGRAIPANDFEPFVHALVVYNAGEILRRVTRPDAAQPRPPSIEAWLPLFEKVWPPYLDGKAGADETVARLLEGFLARATSGASPAP